MMRPRNRRDVRRIIVVGRRRRQSAFDPLSLFTSGELGVWYDFTDTSKMAANSDGSGAVANFGDVKFASSLVPNSPDATNTVGGTYDSSLFGNRGGLTFIGTPDQRLVTGAFINSTFDTAFSFYAVVHPASTGTRVAASSGGTNFYAGSIASDQAYNTQQLSDTQIRQLQPASASGDYVTSFRYNGAVKQHQSVGDGEATAKELATGNLTLGTAMTIGRLSTSGSHYLGSIASIFFINRFLTDDEHSNLMTYFGNRFGLNGFSRKARVYCDGNSLSFGTGAAIPSTESYPAQMAAANIQWDVVNLGVPGATTAQRAAAAPTAIDRTFATWRADEVAVLWEGTNDLAVNAPATSGDAITRYVDWCNGRRAAGFKVVSVTVLPRSNAGLYADFETHRQEINTHIRANWASFSDALADVAADPRIGDFGDSDDTTYYPDKVHLNALGYSIVAQTVGDAVESIITS